MSASHLHLIVNHMPAVIAMVALLTMLVGFLGKSAAIKKLSLGLMVLVAVTGAAAFYSGNAADIFEGSPQERYVERHEESAETTWIVGLVGGAVGLGGLLLGKRMREVPTPVMLVALAVLLANLFLFMKTANLGGQIFHPETRSDALSKTLNPD
jgi:uncharacterized membrane protein